MNQRNDTTNLAQEREKRQRVLTWSIVVIALLLVGTAIGAYISYKRDRLALNPADRPVVESVSETPTLPEDRDVNLATEPGTINLPPAGVIDDGSTSTLPLDGIPAAEVVAVDTFVQSPTSHIGRSIQISGTVDEVIGPTAFILHTTDTAPEQRFLVIVPNQSPEGVDLRTDQKVTIAASIVAYDNAQAKNLAPESDQSRIDNYNGQVMLLSTTPAH